MRLYGIVDEDDAGEIERRNVMNARVGDYACEVLMVFTFDLAGSP